MWTGIGIGTSIGSFFSSAFGIKSIGKSGINPPLLRRLYKSNFKKSGVHWPVAGACLV